LLVVTTNIRGSEKDHSKATDSEKTNNTPIHEDLPADNAIPVESVIKGPYLVYGNNPDEMTIMWEQEAEIAGIVQWGPTESYGESAPGSVSDDGLYGKLYQLNVTGLTPGEKVYYQVTVNGQSVKSFFYAVRTDENETVTFYVGGDSRIAHSNPMHIRTERVIHRMLTDIDQNIDERNSLILYTGDIIYIGNRETDWQTWFRPEALKDSAYSPNPAIYEFLTRIPLMNTVGNHERYIDETYEEDWRSTVYRKYYPYNYVNKSFSRTNSLYYTFTYGPVRVVVIDNMREIKEEQYNWIESVLNNNTHPFVVALYHRPAYGIGYDVNDWGWMQTDVVPLLQKYGVNIAFCGHDHFYNHSVVDGFHHVTSGGFTELRTPGTADHSVKSAKENHFCRIEANPDTKNLAVTVITDKGDIIESFIVNNFKTHIDSPKVGFINVYPNPVNNSTVFIDLELKSISKLNLSVSDMYGSVVLKPASSQPYETGTHKLKIPLSNIVPGTYFLQLTIDDIRQTHKIIVM
jgi:hypothetical protein